MGWAKRARKQLSDGEHTIISIKDSNMEPLFAEGDQVEFAPIQNPKKIRKGDIVFVRVSGRDYVLRVESRRRHQILVGDLQGTIQGWTDQSFAYGIGLKNTVQ